MNGYRRHVLEIGDRVIVRDNHCGPRTANRNPPREYVGVIVEIAGGKAVVDCGGVKRTRVLGQIEYHPDDDVYEARKLEVRINHFWNKRHEAR